MKHVFWVIKLTWAAWKLPDLVRITNKRDPIPVVPTGKQMDKFSM